MDKNAQSDFFPSPMWCFNNMSAEGMQIPEIEYPDKVKIITFSSYLSIQNSRVELVYDHGTFLRKTKTHSQEFTRDLYERLEKVFADHPMDAYDYYDIYYNLSGFHLTGKCEEPNKRVHITTIRDW